MRNIFIRRLYTVAVTTVASNQLPTIHTGRENSIDDKLKASEQSFFEFGSLFPVLIGVAVGIIAALFVVCIIFRRRNAKKENISEPKVSVVKRDDRYIELINTDDESKKYKCGMNDRVTIGRVGTGIVIPDDSEVSRNHCEVIRRGHLYYLHDLNSLNGTKYNGESVYEEIPVISGGIIGVGSKTYRLEIVDNGRN